MIRMYDTVDPRQIGRLASTSPEAVAGYADGRFRDLAEIEELYPHHHHLAIVVSAGDDGDCLDIENGDALTAEAVGWVRRQHARGAARPVLYANLTTMPAIVQDLSRAGIPRPAVRLWMAHFDGAENIPEGFDAHQFTNHWQNRNLDASACLDDFFALQVKPPVEVKPRPRHRPVRVPRPKPIHRKVKGASAGAAIAGAITQLLAQVGVAHITTWEASLAGLLGALAAGWLTPSAS